MVSFQYSINLDLKELKRNNRADLIPDAPDGVYCLDNISDLSQCKSEVIIVRNALNVTEEEIAEIER